jgi:hypothetical protein
MAKTKPSTIVEFRIESELQPVHQAQNIAALFQLHQALVEGKKLIQETADIGTLYFVLR